MIFQRHWTFPVITSLLLAACGGGSPESKPTPKTDEEPEATGCSKDEDCGDASYCAGSPQCLPEHEAADATGCVEVNAPCQQGQICDEETRTCSTDCPVTKDADSDGHDAQECGGDDCDDASASRYPGNSEVCDTSGVDEDCDPGTFGYRDADTDDYPDAMCCNTSESGKKKCGTDCNDQESRVHPTQLEACDGLDNDCSGEVDDVDGESSGYFLDADGDLYGDPNEPLLDCTVNLEAYVTNKGDCNDADGDVNPGEKDNDCDGTDDDCNGTADDEAVSVYFVDEDGDGEGDPNKPAPPCSILGQAAAYDGRDCDDANPMRAPYLVELQCDGIDNNCNNIVDADGTVLPTWYYDADGDGFGEFSVAGVVSCGSPDPGKYTTSVIEDCVPNDATIYPGAAELCDRKDNNCSTGGGVVDEEDEDNDGHAAIGIALCAGGRPADDCDDNKATRYPGRAVLCDGIDNDCDGLLDTADDGDRDGFARKVCLPPGGEADCLDTDDTVYPGAVDLCDNLVTDCNDQNGGEEEREDRDGDGYRGLHENACVSSYDCDDAAVGVNASAEELCDGIDNDCNEGTDEYCPSDVTLTDATTTDWILAPGFPTHADTASNCAAGSVMVGVETVQVDVSGSKVLTRLVPRCQPLSSIVHENGQSSARPSGAVTHASALNFDYVATGAVTRNCAADQVMTQFSVQAQGNSFTATQASCGTLSYPQGATEPTITGEVQLESDGGRSTGGGGILTCPAGYVPTGMHSGMSGSPISQQGIAMTCSRVDIVLYRAASATVAMDKLSSSPIASASSGGILDEAVCPAGQWIAGLSDSRSDRLDGLRLRCAGFSGTLGAVTRSSIANGDWAGGGSTNSADSTTDCGANSFLRGLTLDDDGSSFGEGYQMACAPLVSPAVSGEVLGQGGSVTTTVNGGTTVAPVPTSCPAGRFAYGVRGNVDTTRNNLEGDPTSLFGRALLTIAEARGHRGGPIASVQRAWPVVQASIS